MNSLYLLACIIFVGSIRAQNNLSPPYTCTTTTTRCQPSGIAQHPSSTDPPSQGKPGKRGIPGIQGIKGEKGDPCQCDVVDEEKMAEMRRNIKDLASENIEIKKQIANLTTLSEQTYQANENLKKNSESSLPSSCVGNSLNETIYPFKREGSYDSVAVNCRLFSMDDDGWITIQKRQNGIITFYDKNWENYASGFGNKDEEFWLGLRTIHQLTAVRNFKLRIEMEFKNGKRGHAEYSTFKVGGENEKFRLTISGFTGNVDDYMKYHNKQYFSTLDVDNDKSSRNCARQFHGAWWYNNCHYSHLNGRYDTFFYWREHLHLHLTASVMKIHVV